MHFQPLLSGAKQGNLYSTNDNFTETTACVPTSITVFLLWKGKKLSHLRAGNFLWEVIFFYFFYFTRDIYTKSQKKALQFQPDDIIILPGFPKAWQGMELLNVRLVVKIPGDTNNNTIPREILRQLLGKVAPEIHRQLGHSVAYIDQTEITPVPPDASGRNSDQSKSASSRNSLLIAVGVVLGVVFLFAIIVIV